MASPLPEIIHSLLKERGPAAILEALADQCRQNALFEDDNRNIVASRKWREVAHAVDGAWLATPFNL
jgi:hypothetical protein